jgi:hypothetical protein
MKKAEQSETTKSRSKWTIIKDDPKVKDCLCVPGTRCVGCI